MDAPRGVKIAVSAAFSMIDSGGRQGKATQHKKKKESKTNTELLIQEDRGTKPIQ